MEKKIRENEKWKGGEFDDQEAFVTSFFLKKKCKRELKRKKES